MEKLAIGVSNDAATVEKSAKEISSQIKTVTTATQAVRDQALAAVEGSRKNKC